MVLAQHSCSFEHEKADCGKNEDFSIFLALKTGENVKLKNVNLLNHLYNMTASKQWHMCAKLSNYVLLKNFLTLIEQRQFEVS